jgi:hypothetical protein
MLLRIWLISISKFIELMQPCELEISISEDCETIVDFVGVSLCSAQKSRNRFIKSCGDSSEPNCRIFRDCNLQPITINPVLRKSGPIKKLSTSD